MQETHIHQEEINFLVNNQPPLDPEMQDMNEENEEIEDSYAGRMETSNTNLNKIQSNVIEDNSRRSNSKTETP